MVFVSKWIYCLKYLSNGIRVNVCIYWYILGIQWHHCIIQRRKCYWHWWGGSEGRISHVRTISSWLHVEVSLGKALNHRWLPSHSQERAEFLAVLNQTDLSKNLAQLQRNWVEFQTKPVDPFGVMSGLALITYMSIFHTCALVNKKPTRKLLDRYSEG